MNSVLVVIAHPDDEIFVSGTICFCVENGFRVELVCVTDGEGGGRDLLQEAPGCSLEDIRGRELALSAAVLGVSRVSFLRQPDVAEPQLAGPGAWNQSQLAEALGRVVENVAPDLILTHGPLGGYGHPAHRLVHRCVMAATKNASFPGSVFSFCGKVRGAFFSWHFDEASDVLIDVRRFLDRRVASLSYHQSQIGYFLQPYYPRTVRKYLSAMFGLAFSWTENGRKRVPIATPLRFFRRFPIEGLVLHKAPEDGMPHFFARWCGNENSIQVIR